MACILYLSLGGFYVPSGTGRAVAVVHQGLVIEASAEAANLGVKVGQSASEAKVILRGEGKVEALNPADYRDASASWLDTVLLFSDRIEAMSPHEAFVDLSGHANPNDIATTLVSRLVSNGFTVRAGLAPSTWISRLIALGIEPAGVPIGIDLVPQVVDPQEVLSQIPVSLLTPVSPESRNRLEHLGYRWARDVVATSPTALAEQFGKEASTIRAVVTGLSLGKVNPNYPPGSVSESLSLGCVDDSVAFSEALRLVASRLASRLSATDECARDMLVVLTREDGRVWSSSRRLGKPVQSATGLFIVAQSLTQNAVHGFAPESVRVILRETQKQRSGQRVLVGRDVLADRVQACCVAVETVRAAFGDSAVVVAKDVRKPRRETVLRAWKDVTGWV